MSIIRESCVGQRWREKSGQEAEVSEGKGVLLFITSANQQKSKVLRRKLGELTCLHPFPNSTGTHISLKRKQEERAEVTRTHTPPPPRTHTQAKPVTRERRSSCHQTFQQQCFESPQIYKYINILKLFQESQGEGRTL